MNAPTAKRRQWDVWFEEAERAGQFSDDAIHAAMNWPTCMCGAQDEAIPRFGDLGNRGWREESGVAFHAPIDDQLRDLGLKFAAAVDEGDVEDARYLGAEIDKRAAEVLAELAREGRLS